MKPDIYQVESIGTGMLFIMAKPVSGEWIEEEFVGIANEGVNQVVSLLERGESFEVGLENESELVFKNGMNYISFQIKDRCLPPSVKQFSKFTKDLYHQIAAGENTVIHCRSGIGRSALVVAGVLLHCGFTAQEAFQRISESRGVQVPDTVEQEEWLIENSREIANNT